MCNIKTGEGFGCGQVNPHTLGTESSQFLVLCRVPSGSSSLNHSTQFCKTALGEWRSETGKKCCPSKQRMNHPGRKEIRTCISDFRGKETNTLRSTSVGMWRRGRGQLNPAEDSGRVSMGNEKGKPVHREKRG